MVVLNVFERGSSRGSLHMLECGSHSLEFGSYHLGPVALNVLPFFIVVHRSQLKVQFSQQQKGTQFLEKMHKEVREQLLLSRAKSKRIQDSITGGVKYKAIKHKESVDSKEKKRKLDREEAATMDVGRTIVLIPNISGAWLLSLCCNLLGAWLLSLLGVWLPQWLPQ